MKCKSSKLLIILYIIVIILITSSLAFTYTQHKKYVMCVAGNDQLSLINLNSVIEDIIVCHDENELTQEKYEEFRNKIKIISRYISRSDNLNFMVFDVEELIDIFDKDEFIKKKMEYCIKINNKTEAIFKNEHDAMLLYKYFKNKDNQKEFLKLFGRDTYY